MPLLIMLIQLLISITNIIFAIINIMPGFYKTLTLASVFDFPFPSYLVPKFL